jgi:hypothetical protein
MRRRPSVVVRRGGKGFGVCGSLGARTHTNDFLPQRRNDEANDGQRRNDGARQLLAKLFGLT